jgi:hypothetical protein
MSAARDTLLTEDDDPEPPAGTPPPRPSLASEGLLNGRSDAIPAAGPQRHKPSQADEVFDIIETDDAFQPIQARQAPAVPFVDPGTEARQDEPPAAPEGATEPRQHQPRTRRERREMQRHARSVSSQREAFLEGEVERLRKEMDSIGPRIQQIDQQGVQNRISEQERKIEEWAQRGAQAKARLRQAMADNDPDAFSSAMDERETALIEGQRATTQLNLLKNGHPWADGRPVELPAEPVQRIPQTTAPTLRQPSQRELDRIADFRDEFPSFMDRNTPAGSAFTAAVAQLDRDVFEEGYNPASDAYWDELRARMEEAGIRDPSVRKSTAVEPAQRPAQNNAASVPPERRGPPTAPTTGGNSTGRRPVYMSPERKQAMINAGAIAQDGRTINDKAYFARLMKQYADYDAANGTGR